MKIFEYNDYRKFLRDWLQDQKTSQPQLTFAQVAADIGMQRPAFSKALQGDANFSADQVFNLCERLKLTEEEAEYFGLLVEQETTGLAKRRKFIRQKMRTMQKRQVVTPKALAFQEQVFMEEEDRVSYYSNPWASIIHIYLTIPEYQSQPKKIAKDLQLSEKEFTSHLALLERMKLIKNIGTEKWTATNTAVHSKDLSALPQLQQTLIKTVSLQRLSVLPLSERYGLCVTFSADEDVFEEMRQQLVKTVESFHKKVAAAESKRVYQLSIDLFPWSKDFS